MTELFTPDGHLTDEALAALADGRLDDLQRLEVGEHLSYCDRCLSRYTDLLTGESLIEPPRDQTLPTLRRVQRRQLHRTARRYAAAVAAVAVGSTLWYCGVFRTVGETLSQPPLPMDGWQQQTQPPAPPEESLSSRILKAVDDWSGRVKQAAAPALGLSERPRSEQHMEDDSL